jgi:hypothetical protein
MQSGRHRDGHPDCRRNAATPYVVYVARTSSLVVAMEPDGWA